MTTTVKIHVNGRYKATVTQTDSEGNAKPEVEVHGNYEGSPNPSGEHSFTLGHPPNGTFSVKEEVVPPSDSLQAHLADQ